MTVNLNNSANALETAIRESNEFLTLQKAYADVNSDAQAKQMFDQFRTIQMNLQQKQMTGQNITDQEVQQAQETAVNVQQNEKIFRLMQAEQQMSQIIGEINQILMKPINELYGQL